MLAIQNLETKDWSGAGSYDWDLRTLLTQQGGNIYAGAMLLVDVALTITTGAGGGCTAKEIRQWISDMNIRCKAGVLAEGISYAEYYNLAKNCLLLPVGAGNDVAADATGEAQHIQFVFPLALLSSAERNLLPLGVLADQGRFRLRLGDAALNANTTIDACRVRLAVAYQIARSVKVPPLPYFTALTDVSHASLPDGVYLGLGVMPPAGVDTFSLGDIAALDMMAGQERFLSSVSPSDVLLTAQYDQGVPYPAAWAGTFDNQQDWADLEDSNDFLPLIWQSVRESDNRLSRLVDTQRQSLVVEIAGNLSTARYVIARVGELRQEYVDAAVRGLGADPAGVQVGITDRRGALVTKAKRLSTPGLRIAPARVIGTNLAAGPLRDVGK